MNPNHDPYFMVRANRWDGTYQDTGPSMYVAAHLDRR